MNYELLNLSHNLQKWTAEMPNPIRISYMGEIESLTERGSLRLQENIRSNVKKNL
jgi:hypothetical protein